MSKESEDRDYKPTLPVQKLRQSAANRPKRNTRRPIDYTESVIILEEESDQTGTSEIQLADRTPVRERYREGAREVRAFSTDSIWGSSDRSLSSDCWSPGTLQSKTKALTEGIEVVKFQLGNIKIAKKEELSVTDLMKMMLEMSNRDKEEARKREVEREERAIEREEERRREEDRREERRIEREERDKQVAAEREVQLLATLKAAQPAVPQTVHLDSIKLPVMSKGEDIELFLELFESVLVAGGIPEDKWVPKLHSSIDTETKLTVKETITTPGVTYEEIKRALVGQTHLTFAAASESLVTLDQGVITKLPIRQAVQKVARLFEKVTNEATSMRDMCLYSAVAVLRVALARDCKQYIDVKGACESNSFCCSLEEWQRTNPGRPIWDNKGRHLPDRPVFSPRQPYRPAGQVKRPGECFHCGKMGHFAAECRSRLAGDRPALPRQEAPVPAQQPATRPEVPKPVRSFQRPMADTTCFNCHQRGHISPNCPMKKAKVKKVRVDEGKIEMLKHNEVFGAIGPHRMPITLDTGAEVSVVPEEAVDPEQFSGKERTLRSFNNVESIGKVCTINVTLGEQVMQKEAVTQPGASLGWSACLSFDLKDPEEREALATQIEQRAKRSHKETLYVPPEVREGMLISGVLVKDAKVVKMVKQKADTVEQVPVLAATAEAPESEPEEGLREQVNNTEEDIDGDKVVETKEDEIAIVEGVGNDEGKSVEILAKAEESGSSLGGEASREGEMDLQAGEIREGMMSNDIREETKTDPSLAPLLKLGEENKEGYYLVNGILMRSRTDTMGENITQLCVPTKQRPKCVLAAHNSFGHQGRNKMIMLLRPHFYWPNMSRSCRDWVRTCERCQACDKTTPKQCPIIQRQITTQPFADVAIDLVGPFPTASGGYKHLLTCIDTSSRWPEAIPIRSTTTRTIINCMTDIFTRNGFPERITLNNGPQFTSKQFQTWLTRKGITHSKATPYHPQGNGMVERLHLTLGAVIVKTMEVKGNWAKVIPLALYFLRCTPSASTGVSPFLVTHGWEPRTPLKVLYESWVQQDLGGIDLSEWIAENQYRVEVARDNATATALKTMEKRQLTWDKHAVSRSFSVSDKVWVRRPGLDQKLRESWAGPGTVVKVNSPVSYRVQTPDRLIPTVHVQQLKLATTSAVKKIAAVVQETIGDELTTSVATAKIQTQELTVEQHTQLKAELEKYTEVLTKDPGLTTRATFDIDTGDAEPVRQRPYSTPVALKDSVNKELEWLLQKGYIVPSSSPWSSPMVTVRKPDGTARICVDFRRVNSLTKQRPFFMPRMEEVIEGIGKARFISKLDLSKGFYQVQLTDEAREKTAFTCHKGAFHFTRMLFGVKNAPACFQSLMQQVLAGVEDFATAYMDDVVIFSSTWEDHVVHVGRVLQVIGQA